MHLWRAASKHGGAARQRGARQHGLCCPGDGAGFDEPIKVGRVGQLKGIGTQAVDSDQEHPRQNLRF